MTDTHSIGIGRVYDAHLSDSYRVLVDRLWPRGISKDEAALDEWLKDAAPSTELRRWYGHEPGRFEEFASRYREELERPPGREAVQHLIEVATDRDVLLLTATRDLERSGAKVLQDHLESRRR